MKGLYKAFIGFFKMLAFSIMAIFFFVSMFYEVGRKKK